MTIESTTLAPSKPKKRRRINPVPYQQDISSMTDASLNLKVSSHAITFDELPLYSLFSLNRDGSFPKIKNSKVGCICLTENKQFHITSDYGSRVYRVHTA